MTLETIEIDTRPKNRAQIERELRHRVPLPRASAVHPRSSRRCQDLLMLDSQDRSLGLGEQRELDVPAAITQSLGTACHEDSGTSTHWTAFLKEAWCFNLSGRLPHGRN